MDTFVRLTKSPVVSIAKIRGCVRGVSSEFVLACDMRFASRENTLLGQPEVGVGVHPGGGGTERLPQLVGRGRALDTSAQVPDIDDATFQRYAADAKRNCPVSKALAATAISLNATLARGADEESRPHTST